MTTKAVTRVAILQLCYGHLLVKQTPAGWMVPTGELYPNASPLPTMSDLLLRIGLMEPTLTHLEEMPLSVDYLVKRPEEEPITVWGLGFTLAEAVQPYQNGPMRPFGDYEWRDPGQILEQMAEPLAMYYDVHPHLLTTLAVNMHPGLYDRRPKWVSGDRRADN